MLWFFKLIKLEYGRKGKVGRLSSGAYFFIVMIKVYIFDQLSPVGKAKFLVRQYTIVSKN